MARPRVFVSSTYYDLKHLRASIEAFVESLGYEPVLSEKGDIAYAHDVPLDESCYREVRTADIFVLVIGGRYGSERSGSEKKPSKAFFDRYDSVTKMEYRAAADQDIPIYIFIERAVNAEYQTFLRNKEATGINYAHVDSVNVFHLIEEILTQPRNNPVREFDRYNDIEDWLREQWAGLFKDMLLKASSQSQLASLQTQVTNLAAMGATLQRYLEEVVHKVAPADAAALITEEQGKIKEVRLLTDLTSNLFVNWLDTHFKIPVAFVIEALSSATSFQDLIGRLQSHFESPPPSIETTINASSRAQDDANLARVALGLHPLPLTAVPRHKAAKDLRGAVPALEPAGPETSNLTTNPEPH